MVAEHIVDYMLSAFAAAAEEAPLLGAGGASDGATGASNAAPLLAARATFRSPLVLMVVVLILLGMVGRNRGGVSSFAAVVMVAVVGLSTAELDGACVGRGRSSSPGSVPVGSGAVDGPAVALAAVGWKVLAGGSGVGAGGDGGRVLVRCAVGVLDS